MLLRAVVLAMAALLACAAPGGAASSAERQLDAEVGAVVKMKGGPPGAIAVVQRGAQRTVARAGFADVRTRAPMRATDEMRMASTAKAFSGAVALSLVDKGVLSLSDTIGQRLPSLPAAWASVTLAQALQHTSGLPDFSKSKRWQAAVGKNPRVPILPHARLLRFVASKPLVFAPGSEYEYDNSDNIVVALMAEAATGQTYNALLASEVYAPLGLDHTTLPDGFRLHAPYIHGYDVTARAPEDISTALSSSTVWASGGIVSTPDDATRFIRGYVARKLFGEATQNQQLALVDGHSEPIGPGMNRAGLGVFEYATRCGTVYGHTGNYPAGYTQFMASSLDGTRSVTFSINEQLNSASLKGTARKVFAALRRAEVTAICAALG
jgi:D-alanyl-D-alanine carboxypeptidase